eukprot:scaffold610_cov352-Pavlova_lutheri.AAC.15
MCNPDAPIPLESREKQRETTVPLPRGVSSPRGRSTRGPCWRRTGKQPHLADADVAWMRGIRLVARRVKGNPWKPPSTQQSAQAKDGLAFTRRSEPEVPIDRGMLRVQTPLSWGLLPVQ